MTAAARPHRHRTLLAYAATTVALVTLGACSGGDPAPTVTTPPTGASSTSSTSTAAPTTTTSTPSTTPSVDPVLAKIPAAARGRTADGSVAYAEFFMSQVNVAFTQAKPEALTGLFEASCTACREFQTGAAELKKDGLRHQSPSLETRGANSNEYTSKVQSVAILVAQKSVPVVDASGRAVRRTKAGAGTLLATLKFRDRWIIVNLQVAK